MVQTDTLVNLDGILAKMQEDIRRLSCICAASSVVSNFADNDAIDAAITNGTLQEYQLVWNDELFCLSIILTIEGVLQRQELFCVV